MIQSWLIDRPPAQPEPHPSIRPSARSEPPQPYRHLPWEADQRDAVDVRHDVIGAGVGE